MTDLKSYIEINHYFMTTAEMAEETGEDVVKINNLMSKNGWKAISQSDRIQEYIQSHPEAIVEDVAEKFGKHPNQIREYAAKVGIRLKTRFQVSQEEKREAEKPKGPKMSFTSGLFPRDHGYELNYK